MAITISGGNLTIVYPVTTAKATAILTAAAHYLWDVGYGDHGTPVKPILFDELTNAKKLALVDQYIKRVIMDAAKSYSVNAATETARSTASTDADTNLTL